tara:strand:+ start:110 stop:919 length:810 start_codon:yes stop_codon:yes gene_type:complete
MAFKRETTGTSDPHIGSRLTGPTRGGTSSTDPYYADTDWVWDYMDGYWIAGGTNANLYSWMWKSAKSFFSAVAYTGNSTAGRTVSHNLGVAPEMMWIKSRSNSDGWKVYHKDTGATKYLTLNSTSVATTDTWINNTAPTDSVFTLGGSGSGVNYSGLNYIAYLFASLDGISKVGSYSGTGTAQNIDCGFTSGARFILIKRTDSTGDWYFWDTERGISAGNDPYLLLNSSAAEVTTTDYIDPLSSGFTVTSSAPSALNANGGNYIFYAIA